MQKVILIVVQDTPLRSDVTQTLRGERYLVLAVADGKVALEMALHTPIALLILDLQSIQSEGLELCRQLRPSSETPSIPILMLVASAEEIAQQSKRNPKIDDFLLKPLLPDELRTHVRGLLRRVNHVQKVVLVVGQGGDERVALVHHLRREEYLVLAVADGMMALDLVRDNLVSLVILDSQSLRPDGLELCRRLRGSVESAHIPILMFATSDDEVAQIVYSGLHVDDFLLKPIVWVELRACVQALLRSGTHGRRKKSATGLARRRIVAIGEREVLVAENLRIDVGQDQVTRGDREIKLTSPLLFDLLVYLLRHRGIALTRDQILQQVWGNDFEIDSRTVDVHIHWLRKKLQDDLAHPRLIQTVPGVGYRFKE